VVAGRLATGSRNHGGAGILPGTIAQREDGIVVMRG
jgi:hypothetical protein